MDLYGEEGSIVLMAFEMKRSFVHLKEVCVGAWKRERSGNITDRLLVDKKSIPSIGLGTSATMKVCSKVLEFRVIGRWTVP